MPTTNWASISKGLLSTAPGTWSRVGTVGANTTKYSDKGLTSKTSYLYRVQAYNVDGVSEYTNTGSGHNEMISREILPRGGPQAASGLINPTGGVS